MKPRIYIDLDGVLADFPQAASDLFGKPNPYVTPPYTSTQNVNMEEIFEMSTEDFCEPMGYDYWLNIKPYPDAMHVVQLAESVVGEDNVFIATAPVMTHGCSDGKREWVHRHLGFEYLTRTYIGKKKYGYAHEHAFLIDDQHRNIDPFREYGGSTFLYPRPWNNNYSLEADRQILLQLALKDWQHRGYTFKE
jgi:5'(3')-deoxyribonucleotidase